MTKKRTVLCYAPLGSQVQLQRQQSAQWLGVMSAGEKCWEGYEGFTSDGTSALSGLEDWQAKEREFQAEGTAWTIIKAWDTEHVAPSPQVPLHFPTPGTWEYVTRSRGIKVGDEMKVANQLTLNREVILDYLGESNGIAALL